MNSLASAIVGGIFVLVGVLVAEYLTYQRDQKEEKKRSTNFLKSIQVEINIFWTLYFDNIGGLLESYNEFTPFYYTYFVEQEYFTIYTNNSHFIGALQSDTLRNSIVRCYIKAQSLLGTYQLNNNMLSQHELYVANNQQLMFKDYKELLQGQTQSLKAAHHDLKNEVETLNKLLKEYIEK